MAKYLDPKADLTFKKVFGEHKDLMISFLNALLPLKKGEEVKQIEYLQPELVPDSPLKKDTIVDVRCTDEQGRSFIVEMQMIWTPEFMKRVLLNATKAYSRQIDKGGHYEDLQPVYSLNLVNDRFRDDTEDYYHDYGVMDIKNPDETIDEMHLIFVELPKFKPHSFHDKKMMVLWLRYLTEIDEKTRKVPDELLSNPETRKALDIVEESAYTDAQMAGYDHFWEAVSWERTLVSAALRRSEQAHKKGYEAGHEAGLEAGLEAGRKAGLEAGRKEGMEKGMEEGIEKGMEKGMEEGIMSERLRNAKAMKRMNIPLDTIIQVTGLSKEEIDLL